MSPKKVRLSNLCGAIFTSDSPEANHAITRPSDEIIGINKRDTQTGYALDDLFNLHISQQLGCSYHEPCLTNLSIQVELETLSLSKRRTLVVEARAKRGVRDLEFVCSLGNVGTDSIVGLVHKPDASFLDVNFLSCQM